MGQNARDTLVTARVELMFQRAFQAIDPPHELTAQLAKLIAATCKTSHWEQFMPACYVPYDYSISDVDDTSIVKQLNAVFGNKASWK